MTWRPTRRSVAAWATYDLANTAFALGVGGLYFAEWVVDINDWRDFDCPPEMNYLAANAREPMPSRRASRPA